MERTRTTALPQDVSTPTYTRTTYSSGDPVVLVRPDDLIEEEGYSTMTDIVIDNYHSRSKQGEIFINPMTKYSERKTRSPIQLDFKYDAGINATPPIISYSTYVGEHGDNWERFYPMIPIPVGISDHLGDLCQIALTNAFAGSTVQKASALVTIGEGKETVTGVVDVYRRLLRILTAVRTKQYKHLKKELHPSELADFWMEIRYGIRPIIFDLLMIVDALKDTTEVGSRLTSRGFKEYSYKDNDVLTIPEGNYDMETERSLELTYNVRSGVLSQVDRIGYFELFGVADIVGTVYDLTTLSFVVDWFFNLGDTIASVIPEANLTTLGAWTVETTVVKQTARPLGPVNCTKNPNVTMSGTISGDPWTVETTEVVRTPHERASFLPRFTLNLNWAKVIDLSIIGRNILKSLRSKDARISRHGRLIRK